MTPGELLEKANRALASAKLLLVANDVDGACNRGNYAMYDAARAALLWSGTPLESASTKTHSGLISAFSLHLVKSGKFPVAMGKALNRAAEIRLIADYTGDEVPVDKAQWVIDRAAEFVAAVNRAITP